MRRLALAAFLALLAATAAAYSPAQYRLAFGPDWAAAEDMARDLRARLLARLGDAEWAAIGTAVAFPELTRYSYIRDVAETSALELAYVLGAEADFSIGKLQMKPSFAETMERLADDALRARFPGLFPGGIDERTARGLRIRRLKSDEAEADYLALFLILLRRRHPDLERGGPAAVAILAAAYNAGPEAPRAVLEEAAAARLFPYGRSYKGEQFGYAEIARLYYEGSR